MRSFPLTKRSWRPRSTSTMHSIGSIGSEAHTTSSSHALFSEKSTRLHRATLSYAGTFAPKDARFGLDPMASLKAFRLIGGFDGISQEELREAFKKVRDVPTRSLLEQNLDRLFSQFDADRDGVLNMLEFDNLLQESSIVQKAVYALLERVEQEEESDLYFGHDSENRYGNDHPMSKHADIVAMIITLLNVGIIALQIDVTPGWQGWFYFECVFVVSFTLELAFRYALYYVHNKPGSFSLSCFTFIASPLVFIDVLVVAIGWVDFCLTLSNPGSINKHAHANISWACLSRVARFSRLIRIFWHSQDLRVFIYGIVSSVRSAALGLGTIILIVFMWSVVIRTAVANEWAHDRADDLKNAFPNLPDSMLVVFRCMAISADGSCAPGKPYGSIFVLLSAQFGWVFKLTWVASEVFILVGIFNVITSICFLQACENATRIQESMCNASRYDDVVRLQQLDKLLRMLIHPGREQSNPKDGNAAAVARMIRTEYPEAAAQIPDLEKQIVHFAHTIQGAKKIHQTAMNVYEAKEVAECKQLKSIPCATSYVIDGCEALLVDDDSRIGNSLMLPMAPMGAVQVALVQDVDNLEILLEQAQEVQKFVKKMILPGSAWAVSDAAGSSEQIWKQSKGLCDEAYDPGPKGIERILKKVAVKYQGRFECNRDYARLALTYDSVAHLIHAIPRFLEFRLDRAGVQVVFLENRFLHPAPLGWRDVTLLLKVRLPVAGQGDHPQCHHIMELQLRLKELTKVSDEGHVFYREIRANLPDALLTTIIDRLVTDTTLDLGITRSEWLQCLPNSEVRKLLDSLGIPPRCRRALFDIIDVDGSGTVTSSELFQTLQHFKTPLQAHELTGCHSRVRDIQRHVQTKLEPQLALLHKDLAQCIASNGDLFASHEYVIHALHTLAADAAGGKPIDSELHAAKRGADVHAAISEETVTSSLDQQVTKERTPALSRGSTGVSEPVSRQFSGASTIPRGRSYFPVARTSESFAWRRGSINTHPKHSYVKDSYPSFAWKQSFPGGSVGLGRHGSTIRDDLTMLRYQIIELQRQFRESSMVAQDSKTAHLELNNDDCSGIAVDHHDSPKHFSSSRCCI